MASQAHKHNATGRDARHHPSKAERQAAMNPNNKPQTQKVDDETRAEIDKELAESQTKSNVPAPVADKPKAEVAPLKPVDPNRGMALRTRWSAVLKKRPEGTKLVLGADIKILPKDAVITAVDLGQTGNPKMRYAATRFEKYGFKGQKGATTTVGKYVEAIKKLNNEKATEAIAYADIAWDINHGFIEVATEVAHPVDETKPDEVAVAAHEVEREAEEQEVEQATPKPESEAA